MTYIIINPIHAVIILGLLVWGWRIFREGE